MKHAKILFIFILLLVTMSSSFATFSDPFRNSQIDSILPDNQVRNHHDGEQGYGDSFYYTDIYFNQTSNLLEWANKESITSTQSSSADFAPTAPIVCDYDDDDINELITFEGSTISIYNGENNQLNFERSFSAQDDIVNINCADFTGALGDFIFSANLGVPEVAPFDSVITGLPDEINELVVLTKSGVEIYNEDGFTGGAYSKVENELFEVVDLTGIGATTVKTDLYCTPVLKQGDYSCSFATEDGIVLLFSRQDAQSEMIYEIKTIDKSLLQGGTAPDTWVGTFVHSARPTIFQQIRVDSQLPTVQFNYQGTENLNYYYRTYLNDTFGQSLTANSRIAFGQTTAFGSAIPRRSYHSAIAYDFDNNGVRETCYGTQGLNGASGAKFGCIEYGTGTASLTYSSTSTSTQYFLGFLLDFDQTGDLEAMFYNPLTPHIQANQGSGISNRINGLGATGYLRNRFIRPININVDNDSQMLYVGDGSAVNGLILNTTDQFPSSLYTPYVTNAKIESSTADNYYYAFFGSDLNGDFVNEIIAVSDVGIDIFFGQQPVSEPSVPKLAFSNDLENGGLYGFYEGNVCQGSVVTIRATECTLNETETCSYYIADGGLSGRSILDRERLFTDFDGASSPQNGSFSSLSPSVSATFNSIGEYNIRVYLEPEGDEPLRTIFNEELIQINVTAGVEGVDCNVAEDFIDNAEENPVIEPVEPPNGDGDGDGDETLLSYFGLESNTGRFFVAVLLTLFTSVWVSNATQHNPFITVLGALLALSLSVVFGLIGVEIIVIGLIVGLIGILLLKYFSSPYSART